MNELVMELMAEIERLQEELDRLSCLNRHYLFHFFDGEITKAAETFGYLMDQELKRKLLGE